MPRFAALSIDNCLSKWFLIILESPEYFGFEFFFFFPKTFEESQLQPCCLFLMTVIELIHFFTFSPCFSWLPEHVTLLARFSGEVTPVKSTVTKAVAEFRRTHADTWNLQKDSFTEEQLEVILVKKCFFFSPGLETYSFSNCRNQL